MSDHEALRAAGSSHCWHPFEEQIQKHTAYFCCRGDCKDIVLSAWPVMLEEKTHGGPMFCASQMPRLRVIKPKGAVAT